MKLNHLDLHVADVQRTALFFEQYFGFELRSSRTSPAIAILNDGHGFVLVLQRRTNDAPYSEGFHVGFLLESEDAVCSFYERAKGGGLDISEVVRNNRGVMTYCRAPGEILVEVSWHRPSPALAGRALPHGRRPRTFRRGREGPRPGVPSRPRLRQVGRVRVRSITRVASVRLGDTVVERARGAAGHADDAHHAQPRAAALFGRVVGDPHLTPAEHAGERARARLDDGGRSDLDRALGRAARLERGEPLLVADELGGVALFGPAGGSRAFGHRPDDSADRRRAQLSPFCRSMETSTVWPGEMKRR